MVIGEAWLVVVPHQARWGREGGCGSGLLVVPLACENVMVWLVVVVGQYVEGDVPLQQGVDAPPLAARPPFHLFSLTRYWCCLLWW